MRPAIVAGLLLLQAVMAFFAWTNPVLPDSNVFSALLIFLVPIPTFLIGFAYAQTSGNKLFVLCGISGVATFLPPSFMLLQIEHFALIGALLLLLTGVILFLLYGFCYSMFFRYLYLRYRWATLLLLPAIITGFEFIRIAFAPYFWLIPAPSRMFAHPLVGILPLIQMSSFTGILGPDFLVCFVAVVMAFMLWEYVLRRPAVQARIQLEQAGQPLSGISLQRAWKTGFLISGMLLVFGILGNIDAALVAKKQEQSQRILRPALLQANFNPSGMATWDRNAEIGSILVYRQMILEAAEKQADFLVFTENALPMTLPKCKQLWEDIRSVFAEVQLPALIGAITVADPKHSLNMWYHVKPDGKVAKYYIKRSLVPFGEYLPLRWLIDPVLGGINFMFNKSYAILKITAISTDNYDLVRGKKAEVFTIGPKQEKVFLAVCDEAKYPRFFREGVRLGGEAVFSLGASNWFPSPAYFNKQLQNCAFRAVESRRWIAHLSSMGGSAQVDALGQVRKRSVYKKRSVLVEPIPGLQGRSFYMRCGDIFGWSCLLFALLGYGWILREHFQQYRAGQSKI